MSINKIYLCIKSKKSKNGNIKVKIYFIEKKSFKHQYIGTLKFNIGASLEAEVLNFLIKETFEILPSSKFFNPDFYDRSMHKFSIVQI